MANPTRTHTHKAVRSPIGPRRALSLAPGCRCRNHACYRRGARVAEPLTHQRNAGGGVDWNIDLGRRDQARPVKVQLVAHAPGVVPAPAAVAPESE